MAEQFADTVRFYQQLDRLADRVGGPRLLRTCRGGMGWPPRGVYFFYENGESRSGTGAEPRVVRIGTHGLRNGSRSTLWGRLSQTSRQFPIRSGQPSRVDLSAACGCRLGQPNQYSATRVVGRCGNTSTLELGIDIGDIECVAQIGPPFSVASLRQRLGRSGRRPGQPAVLRIYAIERETQADSHPLDRLHLDLVRSIAMVELLREKWCEPPLPRRCIYVVTGNVIPDDQKLLLLDELIEEGHKMVSRGGIA